MKALKDLFQDTLGAWMYFVHPGTMTESVLTLLRAFLTLAVIIWQSKESQASNLFEGGAYLRGRLFNFRPLEGGVYLRKYGN